MKITTSILNIRKSLVFVDDVYVGTVERNGRGIWHLRCHRPGWTYGNRYADSFHASLSDAKKEAARHYRIWLPAYYEGGEAPQAARTPKETTEQG